MRNRQLSLFFRLSLCALLAAGMLACGDLDEAENQDQPNQQQQDEDDDNGDDDNGYDVDPADHDIAVAGVWETSFDDENGDPVVEVITDDEWDFREMVDFDNDDRWAVTQNPDDADFDPGSYSRIVWTELEDDSFYYCEHAFGFDSEQGARDAEGGYDADDMATGCGVDPDDEDDGFAWTEMTRK